MFLLWHQGFNTTEAAKQTKNMVKVTTVFLGLPEDYMSLLPQIGSNIGLPLEKVESMATRIEWANGLPSSRILAQNTQRLPETIHLPIPGGGIRDQKVDY
mgnify:CR=1 FL=1